MGFSDLASVSARNNRNLQRAPERKYWTEDRLAKRDGPEERAPHTDLAARRRTADVARYVKLAVLLFLLLLLAISLVITAFGA